MDQLHQRTVKVDIPRQTTGPSRTRWSTLTNISFPGSFPGPTYLGYLTGEAIDSGACCAALPLSYRFLQKPIHGLSKVPGCYFPGSLLGISESNGNQPGAAFCSHSKQSGCSCLLLTLSASLTPYSPFWIDLAGSLVLHISSLRLTLVAAIARFRLFTST